MYAVHLLILVDFPTRMPLISDHTFIKARRLNCSISIDLGFPTHLNQKLTEREKNVHCKSVIIATITLLL